MSEGRWGSLFQRCGGEFFQSPVPNHPMFVISLLLIRVQIDYHAIGVLRVLRYLTVKYVFRVIAMA